MDEDSVREAKSEEDSSLQEKEPEKRGFWKLFSFSQLSNLEKLIGSLIALLTALNTVWLGAIEKRVDAGQYFAKEIKDSVEELAESNSRKSSVSLASLYSLADSEDKKNILIAIALSGNDDTLNRAIISLVLAEKPQLRRQLLNANPGLRDATKAMEDRWISAHAESQSIGANADIRPQITNASTQMYSQFSYRELQGWILLGRLPKEVEKYFEDNKIRELTQQIEFIEDLYLVTEGKTIGLTDSKIKVSDIKKFSNPISSPIYIRQAPPSNEYNLKTLSENPNFAVIGILCAGSEVKVLDYKPVKPESGNYSLWGLVEVEKSKACYDPSQKNSP